MESEQLMQEADRWLAEVEKKFPKRNFMATVVNLEGVSIFVTRYVKELKPPEEISAGGAVSIYVCQSCTAKYRTPYCSQWSLVYNRKFQVEIPCCE